MQIVHLPRPTSLLQSNDRHKYWIPCQTKVYPTDVCWSKSFNLLSMYFITFSYISQHSFKALSNDSGVFQMFKYVFLSNLIWNLYCRFNGLSTVNTLLERGADPSVKGRKGDTALHFAARRGNEDVVKILLQHSKVNVNDKDVSGKTALHLACNEGHSKVCQLLLNYGADVKAVSADKTTPLHSAILNGHSQVAIMILNRGKRWTIDSILIPSSDTDV